MLREDFIERMIRQLADMIAGALGKERRGEHAEAQEDLQRAYALLLGDQAHLLDMLDTPSLVRIFGPEERLRALASVCLIDGRIELARGRPETGRPRLRRALELYQSVGLSTDEDREAVREITALLS